MRRNFGRGSHGFGVRPEIARDLLAKQQRELANTQHQQEAIDELRPLTDRQARDAMSAAFDATARRLNSGTVTAPAGMAEHDTYNTCPDCGQSWKDDQPTPGLLHRTRTCEACRQRSLRELGGAR